MEYTPMNVSGNEETTRQGTSDDMHGGASGRLRHRRTLRIFAHQPINDMPYDTYT